MAQTGSSRVPSRIESLRIKNYRALRDVELRKICPLTVFLGSNGSGKSTIFDVFAFLSECFTSGLRKAWDRRGRFKELRSRGGDGPIEIEVKYRENKYREKSKNPIITYHLSIDERLSGPIVSKECLRWKRSSYGKPFNFLDFNDGQGLVIGGEMPEEDGERVTEHLDSPEMLAVNTLGQFAKHPRVSALRRFISGWYLSYLSADHARGVPEAGPQERLSQTGDNLPNVMQYLREQHSDRLDKILDVLRQRIPRLERVEAEPLADGRLLLRMKDAPFEQPVLSKWVSDGTLKMLAYLVALYDPDPPPLIGIEEPENQLHPRLLSELAEECRVASTASQLMVTTHSPDFVNALRPKELWILHRGDDGYTRAIPASQIPGIPELVEEGFQLGSLWMEGHFGIGDPLDAGEAVVAPPSGSNG